VTDGPTYPFTRALVTGASAGIGEAMVHELAAAGVPSVVVARRADRLEELAARHPATEVLAADLTTAEGRTVVEARLLSAADPVDLLVNNAGFGTTGAVGEIDPDRSEREVLLNVLAPTRLTRAVLPRMIQTGRGWVLNVSSIVAFQPVPHETVYAATKAYVQSFTEGLHEELRGTGVVATALCPGLTRTEFQTVSGSPTPERNFPVFMWLSAERVARQGLRDCARGRAVSVPGWHYRLMVSGASVAPRRFSRWAAGRVNRRAGER